jgi:AAA15 family ATPase/GTPase
MIEDIEITNFRCFDRLKVSGCKRINLISGKNNVGKTALLEPIFLSSMPTKDTIISIGNLRKKSFLSQKESSEKMWGDLFFQQNIDNFACSINLLFHDETFKRIDIFIRNKKEFLNEMAVAVSAKSTNSLNESINELLDLDKEQFKGKDLINEIVANILAENTNSSNKLVNDLLGKEQLKDEQYIGYIVINANNNSIDKLIGLSSNYEIDIGVNIDNHENIIYLQNTSFIPSTLKDSSVRLTTEFDQARLKDRDDEVLKAFQIIDDSIVAVESFSIPEPTIYLKRQGEKRLPLSLFGDAMNRIADIILKIINNQDSILLIDEIENGIHHSNQIAFWDFLYRLAEQLNVQIFATTHSLEMTEAFIKAGLDSRSERLCQRPDSAAHFELTRHEKTNKIVAINRDLETLEYAIDRHKEVRGGT